jgi:hypothetical protein
VSISGEKQRLQPFTLSNMKITKRTPANALNSQKNADM